MSKGSRGRGSRHVQGERAEIEGKRLVDSLSAAEAKDALLDDWIALPGRRAAASDIRAFLQERCPAFADWECAGLGE